LENDGRKGWGLSDNLWGEGMGSENCKVFGGGLERNVGWGILPTYVEALGANGDTIDRECSLFDVFIAPKPGYKWGVFPINCVSIGPQNL
jgi:hypothetical protein